MMKICRIDFFAAIWVLIFFMVCAFISIRNLIVNSTSEQGIVADFSIVFISSMIHLIFPFAIAAAMVGLMSIIYRGIKNGLF